MDSICANVNALRNFFLEKFSKTFDVNNSWANKFIKYVEDDVRAGQRGKINPDIKYVTELQRKNSKGKDCNWNQL